MSRVPRFFSDRSSLRLSSALALNLICIVAVVVLRYMLPTTFQRPTLTLPNVGNFSIANWFASLLAGLVAIIQEILKHLIT